MFDRVVRMFLGKKHLERFYRFPRKLSYPEVLNLIEFAGKNKPNVRTDIGMDNKNCPIGFAVGNYQEGYAYLSMDFVKQKLASYNAVVLKPAIFQETKIELASRLENEIKNAFDAFFGRQNNS